MKRTVYTGSEWKISKVEPDKECFEALQLIVADKWDESQGATYFESKAVAHGTEII